jgi:hypothetical protein
VLHTAAHRVGSSVAAWEKPVSDAAKAAAATIRVLNFMDLSPKWNWC